MRIGKDVAVDTILFLACIPVALALCAWGIGAARRHGWASPANLPLPVLAGLAWDNLVISSGRWIGEGALLHSLNLTRFWIHALVTPLLVAWGLHSLRRAGIGWAQARCFQAVAIGAALLLSAVEYLLQLRGLRIVPEWERGVLAYTNAEPASGPPAMVLVVAAVLLVAGAVLWRRQRRPWLFAGTLVMTVGSALPVLPSGAVTNALELVLLGSVVTTKVFQDRSAPVPG